MIVLESKQLVIITPPHTASINLHRALCRAPWDGLWVNHISFDGTMDQHGSWVNEHYRHYRKAVVVRDPLARLRGLFVHYQIDYRRKGQVALPWPKFVGAVAVEALGAVPEYIFRWSITRCVGKTAVDDAIRFESLPEELLRVLGAPVDIQPGWSDDADHEPLETLYAENQPAVRFHAMCWSLPDRARWGYRLPWSDG